LSESRLDANLRLIGIGSDAGKKLSPTSGGYDPTSKWSEVALKISSEFVK
jgi:hypothetical protein